MSRRCHLLLPPYLGLDRKYAIETQKSLFFACGFLVLQICR